MDFDVWQQEKMDLFTSGNIIMDICILAQFVDYCDVLSAVWTLILTAPIHRRVSSGEQEIKC